MPHNFLRKGIIVQQKEKLMFIKKPNCEKCLEAMEMFGDRLEKKYDVKYMSITDAEGLMEVTFHGIQFFPAIIKDNKVYTVMKLAERDLLGADSINKEPDSCSLKGECK